MEETFNYDDGSTRATITVCTSTVLNGIKHDMLIQSMFDELGPMTNEYEDKEKMAIRIAKMNIWPACYAGSSSISIETKKADKRSVWKPLELNSDTFMQLPEILSEKWISVVFKLNPHWNPNKIELPEEEEKKASVPSSG